MYTLHIANKNYSSWSLRPWVLMRELNIPFSEIQSPLEQGTSWESFRKFSPNGLVPCLVDNDTVLWDSLGIVEYLAERHHGIWPAADDARAWARCATAEMHSGFSGLRSQCSMNCGLRIELHSISDALKKDLTRIDELWCEGLNRFGGPFLGGENFTAVDAFFAPVAFRYQTYNFPLSTAAREYASRLLALKAMEQWYNEGLLETWREPEHEQDCTAVGEIRADYRKA